jgi:hypothetical protein
MSAEQFTVCVRCQARLKTAFFCRACQQVFCSQVCLEAHLAEFHQRRPAAAPKEEPPSAG